MKYRKKPIIIDAVHYTQNNAQEVFDFCEGKAYFTVGDKLVIPTLEGRLTASVGDYIIRGIQGEFYPCKPDIFEQTYEEIAQLNRSDEFYTKLAEVYMFGRACDNCPIHEKSCMESVDVCAEHSF